MDSTTLIKGASMFLTGATLGTALTFGTINTFNGGDDLATLEQQVSQYQDMANGIVDDLEGEWQVQIDSANAEIGDYQAALEQANSNILELKEKATTLNDTWTEISTSQAEQIVQKDQAIADLEQDMVDMETNYNAELEELIAQQQQTDEENQAKINEMIAQANAEIKKAEDEIAKLKGTVVANIEDDELMNYNRPQFDLDDENDKTVIDAELDFTMPNKPDDETTGGETGGTESGGTVMEMGSVGFIEIELASVLGDDIYVQFDGMSDLPVYRQAGTNKFRIEVDDLALLTSSRSKVLTVAYSDSDFNDIETTLIIQDSVNSFVGTYTPATSGLDSNVLSLKVIVE